MIEILLYHYQGHELRNWGFLGANRTEDLLVARNKIVSSIIYIFFMMILRYDSRGKNFDFRTSKGGNSFLAFL